MGSSKTIKILALTDIHQHAVAAKSAAMIENPDIILDCGDHDVIENLFGSTPHFYIRGNHEPRKIFCEENSFPLPFAIPNGDLIEFSKHNLLVAFSGIDGNYGAKKARDQVDPMSVEHLKGITPKTIDLLLLHESPLNVKTSAREYPLALQLLSEINRIQPKLVLSGHTGRFSEFVSDRQVKFINMDDMCNGYLVIYVDGSQIVYERKRACHAGCTA